MQAIRYVIPSLMQAQRFVPGMTRTFVPIARNAINAARSRLRPAWEYASRNELRASQRLRDAQRQFRSDRPKPLTSWQKASQYLAPVFWGAASAPLWAPKASASNGQIKQARDAYDVGQKVISAVGTAADVFTRPYDTGLGLNLNPIDITVPGKNSGPKISRKLPPPRVERKPKSEKDFPSGRVNPGSQKSGSKHGKFLHTFHYEKY